ncbi:hypothetical protein JR316_0008312 [Psilocybe cubensis]|uniref:Uncharacterized protein n=2 Tax=Psilocybe cubensis TaxID=181762 RepID=A0A8H7XTH8_PSICU|nr:hypothetical protein JR316_0008312 [Psilocybe cubensis]KAH9479717.1 hypothetical protein JR316_0008312 [Psilocybe cubensis]
MSVCVWLGPDQLTIDIPDLVVFFIWPGKKIILRISILNFTNPSDLTVIDLDRPSQENTMSPETSIIFHELLNINTSPCLLFIGQDKDIGIDTIFKESDSLSFATFTLNTVIGGMEFFERHIVEGDALHSETLKKWFAITSQALNDQDPATFLFDPTILLVGVINHIRATIINNHTFDIQGKKSIAIPFAFIRSWFDILLALLKGPEKDITVRQLLDLGRVVN